MLTDAGIQGAYIALGIILILVLVCIVIVFLMWRRSVVTVKETAAVVHSLSLLLNLLSLSLMLFFGGVGRWGCQGSGNFISLMME